MPSSDAGASAPGPWHRPGPHAISFRPVTRDEFPLLHRWLVTPEVQAWWRGGTGTLADVEREYGPQVAGADPTRSFVIWARGAPVGMIQCYRHADYPDWEAAVGVGSAAGIDYLIGEARNRGRGIGSVAIAAFTALVFGMYPDVEVIVSVPQKTTVLHAGPWRRRGLPWCPNAS
jgi:aminoglycoside 6'-N-acetyltransferase